ncbi:MAG: EF-hand protein [Actinomycetota bacterium]|nr:EF-hand protein [Actinomycetota bacterium]
MDLPENYEATFAAIDADGDGMITAVELRDLMSRYGESLSDDTAAGVIRMMDGDGDGRVTRAEMATYLTQK